MATQTQLDPNRWKALAVLGIAYLMVVLDVSIVNVALPDRSRAKFAGDSDLQWVISGYGLTFGGLLLLGGRSGTCSAGERSSWPGWRSSRSSRCSVASPRARHADRLPRPPGSSRGDPLAVGLLDHVGDVPGGRRAEQGARHPRGDRRLGGRDRRPARRRAHGVRRLGVDLLRQRADRYRALFLVPRSCARAERGRTTALRRARGRHRDGEPHAPRLALTGPPTSGGSRPRPSASSLLGRS